MSRENKPNNQTRYFLVCFFLLMCFVALASRLIYLAVYDSTFLNDQGDARSIRVVKMPAFRGMITDRFGKPLAVSTPVKSIWMNPKELNAEDPKLAQLFKILGVSRVDLMQKKHRNKNKEFVYLKRHVRPDIAGQIKQLKIKGVYLQQEYRRYYPESEVTAQLLGLTDIDDNGTEGMELLFDAWMKGTSGKKKVLKDRLGRVVEYISDIKNPIAGKKLVLSIDREIQHLTYRELAKTCEKHQVREGSVVVLDATTGELISVANYPSYNPNERSKRDFALMRNKALTDTFEPGSIMKAFTIASVLEHGAYQVNDKIRTSPGYLIVDGHKISDDHDYGTLSISRILQRSSNVGITKMLLDIPPEAHLAFLEHLGFGERTKSAFPGEATGYIQYPKKWNRHLQAALGFGYGISVSTLQVAKAYAAIANGGLISEITFLRKPEKDSQPKKRVMSKKVAGEMLDMLEQVVETGTARRAKVKGYRIAGKTGTARLLINHEYDKSRHLASFAGIAPVTKPRFVVVVVLKDPQGKHYYSSLIAAPLYSKIMAGVFRAYNVPPDKV